LFMQQHQALMSTPAPLTILVTGGSGFIGRHLATELTLQGHVVRTFDAASAPRQDLQLAATRVEHISASLEDASAVMHAARGCTLIYHLGGQVGTDWLLDKPHRAVAANIVGTLNVLDAARVLGCRMVYASLRPQWANSYMITKQAATSFCTMYGRELSTDVLSVRLPHVYGPGQAWEPARKVVPNFMRAALMAQPLTVYGTGSQPLDLLYVDDAVHALQLAAASTLTGGACIEVSSMQDISLLDLANRVGRACAQPVAIRMVPTRRGEPHSLVEFPRAATATGNAAIGFEPRIGLDEGLALTAGWMRSALAHEAEKTGHV
jgi:nucleoside-diphosphate-sugar epimerase